MGLFDFMKKYKKGTAEKDDFDISRIRLAM